MMNEFAAREKHLKGIQQGAEQRRRVLDEFHDSSMLLTLREMLDEEDREDVRAQDNFMFRETHLLRDA